jgi:hypothetical protein
VLRESFENPLSRLVRSVVLLLLCCMMPHGRQVNSLATPYHMPIFDALALVRSPHLRGLAAAQGDFHDLWPRTAARDLTTMGFLRHWGDVVFVNTIHPNRAQRTVKLSMLFFE